MSLPGQRSKQLVTELRRSAAAGSISLPRYNDDGVRQVLAESNEHYTEMRGLMGEANLPDLPEPVRVRYASEFKARVRA